MYQPIRLYGADRPRRTNGSPLAICFLLFVIMASVVLILVTAGPLLQSFSLSSVFPAFEETEISLAFEQFMKDNGKDYTTVAELAKRKDVFAFNYRRIKQFNQEHTDVTLGVNLFADLTDEEFEQAYLKYPVANDQCTVAQEMVKKNPPVQTKPNSDLNINWIEKGKVLPVKDQGNCGSCWTFAATCTIESLYAIRENLAKPIRFAEQQIVDCCHSSVTKICDGSSGCYGGLVWQGFEYAKVNGVMKSSDYPYHAALEKCKYDPDKKVFNLDGFVDITPGNTADMEKAILGRPIAVGLSAGYFAFRYYKSGVLNAGCPETPVNHGVVVVGAGNEGGLDYWLVRNSWGGNWGAEGYIKIARGGPQKTGYCGISSCAEYPLYKEPKLE